MADTRVAFEAALAAADCTREAIDPIFAQFYPDEHAASCRYPDEWYADKNNRMAGRPTGHLRHKNHQMVWVNHG